MRNAVLGVRRAAIILAAPASLALAFAILWWATGTRSRFAVLGGPEALAVLGLLVLPGATASAVLIDRRAQRAQRARMAAGVVVSAGGGAGAGVGMSDGRGGKVISHPATGRGGGGERGAGGVGSTDVPRRSVARVEGATKH
jgi:hypothetical protein